MSNIQKRKADLSVNDVQHIQVRSQILNRIEQKILEQQYLKEAVTKDITGYIRGLAKKHGLDEAENYIVKDGSIMVDEEGEKKEKNLEKIAKDESAPVTESQEEPGDTK